MWRTWSWRQLCYLSLTLTLTLTLTLVLEALLAAFPVAMQGEKPMVTPARPMKGKTVASHYQCNNAMALFKKIGKGGDYNAPNDVATAIADAISSVEGTLILSVWIRIRIRIYSDGASPPLGSFRRSLGGGGLREHYHLQELGPEGARHNA